MIDIKNSDHKIIDDTFYNEVHQVAALDFKVRKYQGQPAEKGSRAETIRLNYQREKAKLMEEKQAIISRIQTTNPLDIVYKLTYQGQEYLLDSEAISNIIQLLG